jgi:hypothetical protein
MKIGRAIRALELSTRVPMLNKSGRPDCDIASIFPTPKDPNNCVSASAAFFIHIGGVRRAGRFIAVHRPYFEKGDFGELSQADAKKAFNDLQNSARTYMQEMGVPKHIQEDVLGTPSDRTLLLDKKTIDTYFWGYIPYLHEWLRNRCSKLTDAEMERDENYAQRLWSGASSGNKFSESEREDRKGIREKKNEELACEGEAVRSSRLNAYQKYFGNIPNDFQNYDFSKWSSSTRYLGKRFYEILAEERFSESKLGSINFLERQATSTAPYISLSDSGGNRFVTGISLISSPNPSPEFIKRVVSTLGKKWGEARTGTGTDEWLWVKKGYNAKLAYNPTSASGSSLRLVIDVK